MKHIKKFENIRMQEEFYKVDPITKVFNEGLKTTDKRPNGYVSYTDKTCDSCIFSQWIGTGSRSQQNFICTFLKEGTFNTNVDATCNEFKEK